MAVIQRTNVSTKSKVDSSKATVTAATTGAPSAASVAMRAYQIWRESGCANGNDQAHWFQAEQELRARTTQR